MARAWRRGLEALGARSRSGRWHLVALAGGRFEQVLQLRVPDRLDEELADRVGTEQQHRAQGRVHHDDAPVAVEHDDPLLHRLEDPRLAVTLRPQLSECRREAAREAIERVPQLRQLSALLRSRPHRQVPRRHSPRGLGELVDGRRDALRHDMRKRGCPRTSARATRRMPSPMRCRMSSRAPLDGDQPAAARRTTPADPSPLKRGRRVLYGLSPRRSAPPAPSPVRKGRLRTSGRVKRASLLRRPSDPPFDAESPSSSPS